jgi:hypothetical protein
MGRRQAAGAEHIFNRCGGDPCPRRSRRGTSRLAAPEDEPRDPRIESPLSDKLQARSSGRRQPLIPTGELPRPRPEGQDVGRIAKMLNDHDAATGDERTLRRREQGRTLLTMCLVLSSWPCCPSSGRSVLP